MSTSWIIYLIVPIILTVLMNKIAKQGSIPPDAKDGWTMLRQPKFFLYLGWFSVLLGAVFLAGAFALITTSEWIVSAFITLLSSGFILGGYILVRDARNCRIMFNDQYFEVTHGNGRIVHCGWEELVSGKVHPISKMIYFRTVDERVLKINAYWVGGDHLFEMLRKRTSLNIDDLIAKARAVG